MSATPSPQSELQEARQLEAGLAALNAEHFRALRIRGVVDQDGNAPARYWRSDEYADLPETVSHRAQADPIEKRLTKLRDTFYERGHATLAGHPDTAAAYSALSNRFLSQPANGEAYHEGHIFVGRLQSALDQAGLNVEDVVAGNMAGRQYREATSQEREALALFAEELRAGQEGVGDRSISIPQIEIGNVGIISGHGLENAGAER